MSEVEAVVEVCPTCSARRGQPCVYVWPPGAHDYGSIWENASHHDPEVMLQIDHVGMKAPSLHLSRHRVVDEKRRAEEQRQAFEQRVRYGPSTQEREEQE